MNSREWRILQGTAGRAARQMERDEALAREPIPTIRLFSWDPPAVSLGWKQKTPAWLAAPVWRSTGLEWVERPTGGGIAVHGSDLSVAVVVPRLLGLSLGSLMSSVCQSAVLLCRTFGAQAEPLVEVPGSTRVTTCLAETSSYAVLAGGRPSTRPAERRDSLGIATDGIMGWRKLAGFALRRYPDTWLIQGSLLIEPLPPALASALPPSMLRQLDERAVPLAQVAAEPVDVQAAMRRWAECWPAWWESLLIEELSVAP